MGRSLRCRVVRGGPRAIYIRLYDPDTFEDDSDPEDVQLRAFFRTELHRRNPELFLCFLGGVELSAVLHAALDDPRPWGETDTFLHRYYRLGYWNEDRRGAFPWDMNASQHQRADLDEKVEMVRG